MGVSSGPIGMLVSAPTESTNAWSKIALIPL